MKSVSTAQGHIEGAASRALRTYNDGDWEAAILGFMKELGDHEDTRRLLKRRSELYNELWEAAAAGPEKFHQRMLDCRFDFIVD